MKKFILGLFLAPAVAFSASSPIIYGPDGGGGTCAYNLLTAACVGSGGSGANTELSNLDSPTAINQSLFFDDSADRIISTAYTSGNSKSLWTTSGNSTGGDSGFFFAGSGDADGTSGIALFGSGWGTGTDSSTGNVQIKDGQPTGAGQGGGVSISTSDGQNPGSIAMQTGSNSVDHAGDITLLTHFDGEITFTRDNSSLELADDGDIDMNAQSVNITASNAGQITLNSATDVKLDGDGFYPASNGSYNNGRFNFRWATIYGNFIDFSGAIFLSTPGSPTLTAQADAGSGATCTADTASGKVMGIVTVTTGTGAIAGDMCEMSLSGLGFGTNPVCFMTPYDADAAGAGVYLTVTTTTAMISVSSVSDSTSYVWSYMCFGKQN